MGTVFLPYTEDTISQHKSGDFHGSHLFPVSPPVELSWLAFMFMPKVTCSSNNGDLREVSMLDTLEDIVPLACVPLG